MRRLRTWLAWWLTGDVHQEGNHAYLAAQHDRIRRLERGLESLAQAIASHATREDLEERASLLALEHESLNRRLVKLETKPDRTPPPERETSPAGSWSQAKQRVADAVEKQDALRESAHA